jgi:serine/threonine-protein kinase HipA
MRKLKIAKAEAVQQFRRMIFNVVSRNQDDHTKNIAFLMGKTGKWNLSPAFDVTYAHNPKGVWTNSHQMTINGKRDAFTLKDFVQVGESIGIKDSLEIVSEIMEVVSQWSAHAQEAGLAADTIKKIGRFHRLSFEK